MLKSSNFNNIATYYDFLAWLVFGNAIKKAQIDLLQFIPSNSSILIVGGGTGWIIDEIVKIHSEGLKITYIDSSSKMIELSKQRNFGKNCIEFHQGEIENIVLTETKFDIVFTPFLFDVFTEEICQHVFKKLGFHLNKGGLWLYCDFHLSEKSKYWQKITLKLMYTFFRLTCKVNANKLPKVNDLFSPYSLISKRTYFRNFIVAGVFGLKLL